MNNFFSLIFTCPIILFSFYSPSLKAQELNHVSKLMLGKWKVDYKATEKLNICNEQKKISSLENFKKSAMKIKFKKKNIYVSWDRNNSSKKVEKNKGSWSLEKKELSPKYIEEIKKHEEFKNILKQGYYIELTIRENDIKSGPGDKMVVFGLEKRKMIILDVGCPFALKK